MAAEFRGDLLEGFDLPDVFRFQAWLTAEREEARRLHRKVRAALVERLADQPERALEHGQVRALKGVPGEWGLFSVRA